MSASYRLLSHLRHILGAGWLVPNNILYQLAEAIDVS